MFVIHESLDDGPHEPGALVLDVRNDRWELEVRFDGATYWGYLFALSGEHGRAWTRLAVDCGATPAAARTKARSAWRELSQLAI